MFLLLKTPGELQLTNARLNQPNISFFETLLDLYFHHRLTVLIGPLRTSFSFHPYLSSTRFPHLAQRHFGVAVSCAMDVGPMIDISHEQNSLSSGHPKKHLECEIGIMEI